MIRYRKQNGQRKQPRVWARTGPKSLFCAIIIHCHGNILEIMLKQPLCSDIYSLTNRAWQFKAQITALERNEVNTQTWWHFLVKNHISLKQTRMKNLLIYHFDIRIWQCGSTLLSSSDCLYTPKSLVSLHWFGVSVFLDNLTVKRWISKVACDFINYFVFMNKIFFK